jgi:hypothetical protein
MPRLAVGLITIFIGIVGYFKQIDVFNQDFDISGIAILIYNVSRVLYLFYFFWMLCGLGLLILERLKKKGVEFGISTFDQVILSFYLGGAALTVVMFVLGYFNLYYRSTALILTIPIFALSYKPLSVLLKEGRNDLRIALSQRNKESFSRLTTFLGFTLGAITLFLLGHLLLSRCLYPGGTGNDIYEHYLPFHKAVLQSHGIWPNDVWPNFYNAKGMGITFLSELLTDLLVCQSVSFGFLVVSVLVLFSLTKKILNDSLWAGLAVVSYLACFPHSVENNWGSFQYHQIQLA